LTQIKAPQPRQGQHVRVDGETIMAAETATRSRLDVGRTASTGASALLLLFVLSWVAAVVGAPVTQLWIDAFTLAPADSSAALAEGSFWSLIAGAIAGGAVAFFYNLFEVRR
jgi:hypothetical protein